MSITKNLVSFFSGKKDDKKKTVEKISKYDNESAAYFGYYSRLERSHTNARCGLVNRQPTSLKSFSVLDMSIKAEVYDTCCTTVIKQRYSNDLKSPVEAKYELPLPSYAAVNNFVIEYDDKVYSGKVKEKEKAQNKYSDQIANGGQAFLGEKSDDGLFSISVGNLPPGKEVTVTCSVVSEIGSHLDSLHYCLHKFFFPQGSFNFTFDLDVNLSIPIGEIEVVNNKVTPEFTQDKKKAHLHIQSKSGYSQSIIVVITPSLSKLPSYYLEKKESTIAASFNFYPRLQVSPDDVDQKSEFIFLLDCSGSMSGTAITQAKKALQIIMRSLTENHKFNIYQFGSGFKKLFNESQVYDDSSLERASSHINTIDANLGGTDLLPPIKDILKAKYDPEYPRQVFILTDGEVSDRDKLIDFVGRESNTTRIFTLGIGSGVDIALVTGLSKACKGFYEFINDNKTMEENVMKLLSIAFEPTISNIKLVFDQLPEGCTATQAPTFVRPLYNGERMILSCLIDGVPQDTKVLNAKLTGDGPTGQQVTYPVELDLTKNTLDGTSYIHQLAALNMINDLSEFETKLKVDNKEKIINLSKKYNIISKYTAFIVTIDSNEVTQDTMKTVLVQDNTTHHETNSRLENILLTSSLQRRSSLGGTDTDSYESDSSEDEHDNDDDDEELEEVESDGSILPPPPPPVSNSRQFIQQSPTLSYSSSTSSRKDMPKNIISSMDVDDCIEFSEKSCDKKEKSRKKSSSPTSSLSKKSVSRGGFGGGPMKPLSSGPPPPGYSSESLKSRDTEMKDSFVSGKKKSTGDLLLDLIQAQKANGSWTADTLPFSLPKVPSELSTLDAVIFATLIVMSKIVNNYPNDSTKWDLVIKKATKWVKSQLTKTNFTSISFDDLLKQFKSLAK